MASTGISLHMEVDHIHDSLSDIPYRSNYSSMEMMADSPPQTTPQDLSRSLRDDNNDPVNRLACNLCNASFTTERQYRLHVTGCHKVTPVDEEAEVSDMNQPASPKGVFACDVCGKMFTQQGNVKIHMRVHSKERPYPCTICGKSFTQLGNLQTHLHIHRASKPYVCDVCLRGFTQAGNVKKHRETVHEGKAPLRCDVCGDSLLTPTKLSIHARAHVEGYRATTKRDPPLCKSPHDMIKIRLPLTGVPRVLSADRTGRRDIVDYRHTVTPSRHSLFDSTQIDINACRRIRLEVYYCTICKMAFHSDAELTAHLVNHN